MRSATSAMRSFLKLRYLRCICMVCQASNTAQEYDEKNEARRRCSLVDARHSSQAALSTRTREAQPSSCRFMSRVVWITSARLNITLFSVLDGKKHANHNAHTNMYDWLRDADARSDLLPPPPPPPHAKAKIQSTSTSTSTSTRQTTYRRSFIRLR